MKVGMRTPSPKRSITARTTGKITRKVKSSVNPLYGKSGMGMINDPSKAVYNKVYNKTTKGISDLTETEASSENIQYEEVETEPTLDTKPAEKLLLFIYLAFKNFLLLLVGFLAFITKFYLVSFICFGIFAIIVFVSFKFTDHYSK